MKTRKTVIAVLSAVLLISAALIVGCLSEFEGAAIKKAEEDNFVVPKGKGLIKFKIKDGRPRTIMPTADLSTMYFIFKFTDADPLSDDFGQVTYHPDDGTRELYSSSMSVALDEGTYSVAIEAYNYGTDGSDGDLITAWSSLTDLPTPTTYTIDTTTPTRNVNASLKGVIDGVGTGTFNYHITVPVITSHLNAASDFDYTARTLEVYEDDESALAISPIIDLTDGANTDSDIQLVSGQYWVIVTLSADNCQDRVLRNVMYIYNGLPTYYGTSDPGGTIDVPPIVQNTFIVRYFSNVTPNTTVDGTLSGGHLDQPIVNASAPLDPFRLQSPDSATHNFDGWFTTSGGNTPYNFYTKIFADARVYAQWSLKTGTPGLSFTITFTITDGGAGKVYADDDNPVSPSYNSILSGLAGTSLTFYTDLTNATWKIDGTTIGTNVSSITLDNTNATTWVGHLATGAHIIHVSGLDGHGDLQDGTVTFTITN